MKPKEAGGSCYMERRFSVNIDYDSGLKSPKLSIPFFFFRTVGVGDNHRAILVDTQGGWSRIIMMVLQLGQSSLDPYDQTVCSSILLHYPICK